MQTQRSRSPRKSSPKLKLNPGDRVLVGSPYTPPIEWFFATVLWSDGSEVLTEHEPPSTRELYRQVLNVARIRAVGSYEQLADIRARAAGETRPLSDRVRECESELGRARDALRARIDELAQANPVLCPVLQEAA